MEVIVYATLCAGENEHNAAYRLLAVALKREFGIDELPVIRRETGGKPFFPGWPEIQFNVSHSHGAAAVALHNKPIGIDIEKLRPSPKRLSAGMDDETFFREWTVKEATVKRQGGSIAAVLRQEIVPDEHCCTRDDFLPGWIVTVCPSEKAPMRFVCL